LDASHGVQKDLEDLNDILMQDEGVSPTRNILLPQVDLDNRGRFSSQNILSSGQESNGFRPPANEAELAAALEDALNALDDLGDVPVPAAHAVRDESAESELF